MSKKRKIFFPVLFSFCFISFILGWLMAISFYPKLEKSSGFSTEKLPPSTKADSSKLVSSNPSESSSMEQKRLSDEKEFFINSSVFKEMQKSVMALFDPYTIDRFSKKDTTLTSEKTYIDKKKSDIQLKNPSADLKSSLESKKIPPLAHSPILPLKPNSFPKKLKLSQSGLNLSQIQKIDTLNLDSFLQKAQQNYDEKNKEQLTSIEKQQKFFKSSGKFSFLVNAFSDEKTAFEYIEKMKKEYPFWSFLLKAHGDHIRIYLGPFTSKELALEFKKEIPLPYPFSSFEYLEEVGL